MPPNRGLPKEPTWAVGDKVKTSGHGTFIDGVDLYGKPLEIVRFEDPRVVVSVSIRGFEFHVRIPREDLRWCYRPYDWQRKKAWRDAHPETVGQKIAREQRLPKKPRPRRII